jgi:hypothetical protein
MSMVTADTPDLSAQLLSLVAASVQQEDRCAKLVAMNNTLLDMHSAIMEWVVNTDYPDAADEVQAILESFVKKARNDRVTP